MASAGSTNPAKVDAERGTGPGEREATVAAVPLLELLLRERHGGPEATRRTVNRSAPAR